MNLIDGKKVSADIKIELTEKVSNIKQKYGLIPGLVTILVGESAASQSYVKMKGKACNEIGMFSVLEKHDSDMSEEKLLELIKYYNNLDTIHGILVQLPLPKHIDENKIIEAINPLKDVDGFHPISVGNLVIGKETYYPCTPYGIVELLQRYNIETKGKHCVVVGRSNIVGKPIANMMLQKKAGANSVVTVCHSAAKDLSVYTKSADILIAAIGSPNFITEDMVKDGVVIIDVGINRVEDTSLPKGYKIVGDVEFESVSKKASYITPVPGGVGPMTIAMLMKNTLTAFSRINKINE
ncbi:MAG: bifunctional methylenetetrahydrofolate dehydrogenase/methenyltetrahydrofolate cyclohydrolase FolD [bacterium]